MKIQKTKGFSLIELLCVVAIVSLIVVASTRFFSVTTANNQVTKALQDIQVIRAAANEWLMSQPDYAGGSSGCEAGGNCISMASLNNMGLLPVDLGDGVGKNPWGGNYAVAPNIGAGRNNPNQLVITLSNVSGTACLQLYNLLQNQMLPNNISGGSAGCGLMFPFTFSAYFG